MGQTYLLSLDINDRIYELKSKTHFVLDKGCTLIQYKLKNLIKWHFF
jgi:hypothetical protein